MKLAEFDGLRGTVVGSISGGEAPKSLLALELALIELRDLEWRCTDRGPRLGYSPVATDIPARLIQREAGDVAGEHSETLLVNQAGKELQVLKLDSRRPRSPLSVAEVERLERLRRWLLLLPDATDRRVLFEAAFYLWRGEPCDWVQVARRIGYQRTLRRLEQRYREALARLLCRVNGLPVRHWRALLAREAGYFTSAARRESLGFGFVKW